MASRRDQFLNARLFTDPSQPQAITRPVIQRWLEGFNTVEISQATGFMEWRVANIVAAFQDRCHRYLSRMSA